MSEAVHPGKYLEAELSLRGWAQADLTFVLGSQRKAVNQIINGKQGISPAMSKALGQAFGLPEDHFLSLQRNYDIAVADDPNPEIDMRARMLKMYPIREMVRRGWLRSAESEDLGTQLARFFGMESTEDVPYLAHAAKKTSYEEKEIPASQLVWLFRVRQIAKTLIVPKYNEKALIQTIARMKEMLIAPEEARHVPRLLSECGVRFVVVEAIPQSKIDGVCLWLDKNTPVIGMSLRFDRIDNFWFVLRHELEHVLRGHGRGTTEGMIDSDVGGESDNTSSVSEEEEIANTSAADFIISQEKMKSFLVRKNPFFYEKDVLAFAKINGVHPGIPVGQIQKQTGRYDYLRKHQAKIRECVLPSAIVDGWNRQLQIS